MRTILCYFTYAALKTQSSQKFAKAGEPHVDLAIIIVVLVTCNEHPKYPTHKHEQISESYSTGGLPTMKRN